MVREKPPYLTRTFIKDLWYFIQPHKYRFFFLTSLLAIAALLDLVQPIIISKIVDFFTEYSLGDALTYFYVCLGIILGLGVFSTFLRLGSKHFFTNLSNLMQRDLKTNSFQMLMEGDLAWHDQEAMGNKMHRVNDGASSLGSFMDFYINNGVSMVAYLGGIVVVFTYLGIKYAALSFVFIFTYLAVDFIMNKKIAKKNIEVQIAKEDSAGKAYEFSSNISTVKSLGLERSLNLEIKNKEETLFNKKQERRFFSTSKWIGIQTISIFFLIIFIFLVGRDVVTGVLTVGAIVIYLNYVSRIQGILNNISNQTDRLTDIKYSIYRLMELQRSIPLVKEEDAVELLNWETISLENVSFKYREEEVLENFNFQIHKGEKIGIVGKSGGGKSTLFKLLLKLYLPKKGMIYFDAMPVTNLKRDSIVKRFSIVPQETELFNTTFRENIIVSVAGKFDSEKYIRALEVSQCLPVIAKLKEKDESLIGEKGVRLSGGERQRLGIARAIYRDSDIIIFDESTSNLDYETEKKIQDSLDHLQGKTLIFSAHRLSTLKNVDRIVVIGNGRILEGGTFSDLVRKKGEFYKLLKQQERK